MSFFIIFLKILSLCPNLIIFLQMSTLVFSFIFNRFIVLFSFMDIIIINLIEFFYILFLFKAKGIKMNYIPTELRFMVRNVYCIENRTEVDQVLYEGICQSEIFQYNLLFKNNSKYRSKLQWKTLFS